MKIQENTNKHTLQTLYKLRTRKSHIQIQKNIKIQSPYKSVHPGRDPFAQTIIKRDILDFMSVGTPYKSVQLWVHFYVLQENTQTPYKSVHAVSFVYMLLYFHVFLCSMLCQDNHTPKYKKIQKQP